MKNGKVGLCVAPNFLMSFCQGKPGPNATIQTEFNGPLISIIRRLDAEFSRRFIKVVGWMLLGFMMAGPNSPRLHSQDSRLAPAEGAKTKAPLAGRETTPRKESTRHSPSKAVQTDIVLPDIYIAVPGKAAKPAEASQLERTSARRSADALAPKGSSPADTTKLKHQLQKAEGDLEFLRHERSRLMKNLEQFKAPPAKGANRPAGQRTELLERPSV